MIILTGASGGIGCALMPMLQKIDKVIGIYHNHRPDIPTSERLFLDQVDITDSVGIQGFIERWADHLTQITVIHCAVSKTDGLFLHYSETDWDRGVAVNLKANFLLTKALLPVMLKDMWGRVIHVSSVAGLQGAVGAGPYGATKTGLFGMSRALAKEYAKFNITSNVMELGYFELGLFNALSDKVQQQLLAQIPSKRLGNPTDIVNCVEFLIRSSYVNGATINIDGGI